MFYRAMEAEKVHAILYKQAKEAVAGGQDLPDVPIHVCRVCGFTMDGNAPETCPICGTPKVNFTTF